jgi:hypothetical protein
MNIKTMLTRSALLAATVAAGGCTLFETDVKNPNAVVESALADPSGATAVVNGLGGAVQRAVNQMAGTTGVASDEFTWVGSREYWNALDSGDLGDPQNEYTNGQYPFLSEARWYGDYAVARLEEFDKRTPSALSNRADLARAYVYAGMAYLIVAENQEDFIIASDRTVNAAPIGADNMRIMFDSATAYLTRGLTLAQQLNNAELIRAAYALRARARFSKAVWTSLRPARTPPANPLINDAGASADATAFLALNPPAAWTFSFAATAQNNGGWFSTGGEMNSRSEFRAGNEYIVPAANNREPAAGIAGIRLRDPVSNQPDPELAAAIDACCRLASTVNLTFIVASTKEMRLILAEAALAAGNTAQFETQINAERATNSKPAWTAASGVTPRAMLEHERRVSLFMQSRRLNDHYRFGTKADRWIQASSAFRKACFFPISFDERQQNPLAPQPAADRPAGCL